MGRRRALAILLSIAIVMVAMVGIPPSRQAGAEEPTLTVRVTDTATPANDITSVLSYQRFQVIISYGCTSLTVPCEDMEINVPLDQYLNIGNVIGPTPHAATVTQTASNLNVVFSDPMPGGDTGEIRFIARFAAGATPSDLVWTIAPIVLASNSVLPPVQPTPIDIEVDATPQWVVAKAGPNSDPAVGGGVAQFTITVDDRTVGDLGGLNLDQATVVDTLPAGLGCADVTDLGGATCDDGSGTAVLTWAYALLDIVANDRFTLTYTITYPDDVGFQVGDVATNTVELLGDPPGGEFGPGPYAGPASITHGFADPITDFSVDKNQTNGSTTAAIDGALTYQIDWAPAGNSPATNLTITDFVPTEVDLTGPLVLRWTPTMIKADIDYQVNDSGVWQEFLLGTGPVGTVDIRNDNDYVPGDVITAFRLTLFDDSSGVRVNTVPANFDFTTFAVRAIVTDTARDGSEVTPGDVATNCLTVSADEFSDIVSCHDTELVEPTAALSIAKSATPSIAAPGDIVKFEVAISSGVSTGSNNNPTVIDLLPVGMTIVDWDGPTSRLSTSPNPWLEVENNFNGTGRQLLRFSWDDDPPPPGALYPGTGTIPNRTTIPAVTPNPRDFGIQGSRTFDIYVRVEPTAVPGVVTNDIAITNNNIGYVCYQRAVPSVTDTDDWDGDGDNTDSHCLADQVVTITEVAAFSARKWDQGVPSLGLVDTENGNAAVDPLVDTSTCETTTFVGPDLYTRWPCAAVTEHGGAANYQLVLANLGNVDLDQLVVYDVLPYVGDTGVITDAARLSDWRPFMTSLVTITSDTATDPYTSTVEYSLSTNPCRPEIKPSNPGCVNDWTATPPSPISDVQAIRFTADWNTGRLAPTEEIVIGWEMSAPYTAPTNGEVAWNSLGYRIFRDDGTNSLSQEPPKVGLVVQPPSGPRVSLGNQVWLDDGGTTGIRDNGILDGDEAPIEGVVVNLYDSLDIFLGSDTTDVNGLYLYTLLEPGDYRVEVDASNFSAGGPLEGLRSSLGSVDPDDTDTDSDDNGIDAANPGDPVTSALVTLTMDLEPLFENPANDTSVDNALLEDNDSNLAVDFGFVPPPPVRLGNLVWFDVDNDGIVDVDELPIAGVDLVLHQDDGDDVFDPALDPTIASTETDGAGNYWFDNLVDGVTYFVTVPTDQTAGAALTSIGGDTVDLADFFSSTGAGSTTSENDIDNNDDGDADTDRATNFFSISGPVTLASDAEAENEADTNGAVNGVTDAEAYLNDPGRSGVYPDTNSNLTVDLGFAQKLRLGNLVWQDGLVGEAGFDNGAADAAEAANGIDGITVELWLDNGDSSFDPAVDTQIGAAATTAGGGHYQFDALDPGAYFVAIPEAGNTGPGEPLVGMLSSSGSIDADSGIDDVDDGEPDAANGYAAVSDAIELDHGDNPVSEAGDFGDASVGAQEAAANATSTVLDGNSDLTIDFGFIETPLYRIGNLVWEDRNNDGLATGDEPGVAGVDVLLYLDDDGTPGGSLGDTLVDTHTTDLAGHYLFSDLLAGDYYVVIPDGQAALAGSRSSTNGEEADPNVDGDNNDNGVSPLDVLITVTPGLGSGLITLGEGNGIAEPVDETLRLDDTTDDDDDVFADERSNVSVDFGFYRLRLGNQVWLDEGVGFDDGALDVDEDGINGVLVELYADTDGSGDFDPALDALIDTAVTAGDGSYWFEGIVGGDTYFIAVPEAGNTGVSESLGGLRSSTGQAADSTADNTDDGAAAPGLGYAAVSGPVVLAVGGESVGEIDGSATGGDSEADANAGTGNDVADASSNLQIDFGFVTPRFSIGNEVWIDADDNGVRDLGEDYVADGVIVNVLDGAGNPVLDRNGSPVPPTTTVGGLYLFDDLAEGSYVVEIDPSNFAAGGLLDGYTSSTGAGGDDDVDGDDNGTLHLSGAVRSPIIDLVDHDEPGAEDPDNDPATADDNENLTVDFGFYTVSLGNRVWLDWNNDGFQDDAVLEPPVPGVLINLLDGSGVPVLDAGGVARTATTDLDGLYLFTGLDRDVAYIVEIDASNFATASPLAGLSSSTGSADPDADPSDTDDNGVDQANAADALANGVRSAPVVLVPGAEPLAEDPDNDPDTDDGNENLTVDFGFYKVTLGNRVWFDADFDGVQDGGEPNISGVVVNLLDASGTPVLEANGVAITDTTGPDGLYFFDDLAAGNYVVQIDPSNFAPGGALENTPFSSPNLGTGDDTDDNGLDSLDPAAAGVLTAPVALIAGAAPVAETPDNGDPGTPDSNQNLTVDFGFFAMSLGNRVWLDTVVEDGLRTDDEPVVAGVLVELVDSAGTVIATDSTDTGGYYRFDGLLPGDYVVRIPASNFAVGGPLEGHISTEGNDIDPANAVDDAPDPDDLGGDVDNDDNGSGPENGDVTSAAVTLTPALETSDETDLNVGDDDPTDDNANMSVDFGFVVTPSLSLGNRAWFDPNNDGVHDLGTELGAPGVTVVLLDGSGQPALDRDGVAVAAETTDADGYYLFTNLGPGDYIVELPATNFAAAGALEGWYSSTGATVTGDETDSGDDGIDPATAGDAIRSGIIELSYYDEPLTADGEIDKPVDASDDQPSDDNANMTVDFGFYQLTLGNRVWFDIDNSGDQASDGSEPGIAGVTVELFGIGQDPLVDMPLATTATDSDGYYLFAGLAEGDYVVHIGPDAWADAGPLAGWHPSTGAAQSTDPNDDMDANDDGDDPADPAATGVTSGPVSLVADTEPLGETDTADATHNAPTDGSANATVDFGFTTLTLGNRVWIDSVDENGEIDAGEPGVGGVIVELYDDVSVLVDSTITDPDGYYRFTGLASGEYTVRLPATNFEVGSPLAGFTSTQGNGIAAPDPDDDFDNDDNGNPVDLNGDGSFLEDAVESEPVSLAYGAEPEDETDLLTNGDDDLAADQNANSTVDFGFVIDPGVSLGNRVWIDTDNDGHHDDDEVGVSGVEVQLFLDVDADGEADNGVPLRVTTTNGNGYYLFDSLAENSYVVIIPAMNFDEGGPLAGHASSTPTSSDVNGDPTDIDDNGIDPAAHFGDVVSPTVELKLFTEPLDEIDLAEGETVVMIDPSTSTAVDVALDWANTDVNNSNYSVDFGFFVLSSIGDHVWIDTDRDGLQGPDEVPVEGVTVRLVDPSGEVLATTATDASGHYLFTDLVPGDYLVEFDLSTIPPGHLVTERGAGTDDELDSDGDPLTGRTATVTLDPSEHDRGLDLGIFAANADLVLVKSLATGSLRPGTDATWDIGVTNEGPDAWPGPVTVTDTLPTSLTFVSATGTDWGCTTSGQVVSCLHEDRVEPGASYPGVAVVGTVSPTATGTITNTASLEALSSTIEARATNPVTGTAGAGAGAGLLSLTGADSGRLMVWAFGLMLFGLAVTVGGLGLRCSGRGSESPGHRD